MYLGAYGDEWVSWFYGVYRSSTLDEFVWRQQLVMRQKSQVSFFARRSQFFVWAVGAPIAQCFNV